VATPECWPAAGGAVLTIEGFAEIAQGSDTAMAMIAAETLGIPVDKVRVQSGNTDLSMDLGAYSSRQALMTGHATKEAAAQQVREQIARSLAEEMGCDPFSISFKNGAVLFDGSLSKLEVQN